MGSINNKVFIDLDKENTIPKLTAFQGQIDVKKNGKILVKNSILEDIDTITEQELEYILTNFKQYISPVMTSIYIPSISTMEMIRKLAPECKVRFKTEKPGSNKLVAISPKEFLTGETIFEGILKGIHPDWNHKQKQKYLYNQTASMLSYDLNVLSHIPNAKIHEKYSRNIFTAIMKNWGICDSFAAMYDYLCYRSDLESQVLSEDEHDYVMITDEEGNDYLTDPTYDSLRVKFGLKAENYAISKEEFEKNDHNLTEADVDEYTFTTISEKEMEELDRSTGYLEYFEGKYTNEELSDLANDLEGNTITEQVISFMNRVGKIKIIGRPTDSDYVYIMKWILSKSKDRDFAKKIKISSLAYEDTKELPRRIILRIEEDNWNRYYTFDYKTKTYDEISETELKTLDKDKQIK